MSASARRWISVARSPGYRTDALEVASNGVVRGCLVRELTILSDEAVDGVALVWIPGVSVPDLLGGPATAGAIKLERPEPELGGDE